MARGRGLYGQNEGNENRSAADSMSERIADNEVVEGPHVAVLRRIIKDRQPDWRKRFDAKVAELRREGFSQSRIDSMVTRSYAGVRL